jgi:hypothetical protein
MSYLPPGFSEQPAFGFHDAKGLHQFHRVYGVPDGKDKRGAIAQLDEARSYWSDTGSPAKVLSYGEARTLSDAHLTYAQFSSPTNRRDDLLREAAAKAPPLTSRGVR